MSALQNWETAVYAACIVLQSSGMTLTIPAKLHPEVIVQAVAARDRKRAEHFAKKHGIPEIKDSHQGESWVCFFPSQLDSSKTPSLTLFSLS